MLPYIKLFLDTAPAFELLTDASAGRLIKALFRYAGGVEPEIKGREQLVFVMLRAQLDRDNETCRDYTEKQRINGAKGGLPRKAKPPAEAGDKPGEPEKTPDRFENNPDLFPKNPTLFDKNPGYFEKNPTLSEKNPGLFPKKPVFNSKNPKNLEKEKEEEKEYINNYQVKYNPQENPQENQREKYNLQENPQENNNPKNNPQETQQENPQETHQAKDRPEKPHSPENPRTPEPPLSSTDASCLREPLPFPESPEARLNRRIADAARKVGMTAEKSEVTVARCLANIYGEDEVLRSIAESADKRTWQAVVENVKRRNGLKPYTPPEWHDEAPVSCYG